MPRIFVSFRQNNFCDLINIQFQYHCESDIFVSLYEKHFKKFMLLPKFLDYRVTLNSFVLKIIDSILFPGFLKKLK